MMVNVLLPLPYNGKGIGYTCVALASNIQAEGVEVRVFTPLVRPSSDHPVLRMTLPKACRIMPYRFFRKLGPLSVERRFLRETERGGIAYLWSEVSLDLSRALREQGVLVVREKTNCHKLEAIRIAHEAYERLGWNPINDITESALAKEIEELDLCDYVFSPSPQVRRTLLAGGVDDQKIISTSYGWDPERLAGKHRCLPEIDGVTFLFVGLGSVLKGLPWLLEAWQHAGIRGRLVLAGVLAPDVEKHCNDLLRRDDVIPLGYVSDIGSVYRSADVFVFPSLVEGGPQVTYEAMGCGLPVVVSPMGAGAVARHGVDAFVCDPMDRDAWSDALSRLATDQRLREEMGRAAKTRAAEFSWERVGALRRKELMKRCG
jgi:glycosyltransferase involved in cell wall biosynthesis